MDHLKALRSYYKDIVHKAVFRQYLSAYFLYFYSFHIITSISILKIDKTRNIALNKNSIIYHGGGENFNNP